jgi:hypothetical protein
MVAFSNVVVNRTGTGSAPAGTITATGNVTGGNFVTSGFVRATSVVANVVGVTVTTTANVQAGNLRTTGLISSTGNVTGGNLFTVGSVSAQNTIFGPSASITGAITAGTLNVGTLTLASVTTAGNVTGGNILTVGNMSTAGNNISGGNVAGLNLSTLNANGVINGGSLSVYGNITGGNVSAVGSVRAAAFLNTNGTPYQSPGGPIFMAQVNNAQEFSQNGILPAPANGEMIVVFQSTTVNTNNSYNTTTGIFFPNVAGYYQINAGLAFGQVIAATNGTPSARVNLLRRKYGQSVGSQYATGNDVFLRTMSGGVSTISWFVYLNGVDDTLVCKAGWSGLTSGKYWVGPGPYTYFQACWLRP